MTTSPLVQSLSMKRPRTSIHWRRSSMQKPWAGTLSEYQKSWKTTIARSRRRRSTRHYARRSADATRRNSKTRSCAWRSSYKMEPTWKLRTLKRGRLRSCLPARRAIWRSSRSCSTRAPSSTRATKRRRLRWCMLLILRKRTATSFHRCSRKKPKSTGSPSMDRLLCYWQLKKSTPR